MLSEEEKEAIEYLKARLYGNEGCKLIDVAQEDLRIILNLIETQQAEIRQLKEDMSNMYDEKVVRNILEDECGLSKYEIDEILN